MIVEIDIWKLAGLAVTVLGSLFGMLKWVIKTEGARWEARFARIEANSETWREFERQVLEWKADLPLAYVRRDDYVRNQTVIEAKLDALAMKIENHTLKLRDRQ